MDVYSAEVTFFNCNRRDRLFFSLELLFSAVLLVTVIYVSKGRNK